MDAITIIEMSRSKVYNTNVPKEPQKHADEEKKLFNIYVN